MFAKSVLVADGENARPDGICRFPALSLEAGNETRTRDPKLGKLVLYQLSYSRVATEGTRSSLTADARTRFRAALDVIDGGRFTSGIGEEPSA